MRAADVLKQIKEITTTLIEISLCNQQNFPVMRRLGKRHHEVTFQGAEAAVMALKNRDYSIIYGELEKAKCFNAKMLDGALVQLQYEVANDQILKHRLAFFPAPHFELYEREPEIYDLDELYAEILNEAVVAFPIRFDYDSSTAQHQDVHHPKSHLTLGQYRNCRIPVSAPLSPFDFVLFLLRNFYNPAFCRFAANLSWPPGRITTTISDAERLLPHICVFDCRSGH